MYKKKNYGFVNNPKLGSHRIRNWVAEEEEEEEEEGGGENMN